MFFGKTLKLFDIIMAGYQKTTFLYWPCCTVGLMVAAENYFWRQNLHFLRLQPFSHLFFGVRRIQLSGIISPSHPEVTLDTFGFPEDAHTAGWRAVLWPRLTKMTLFGAKKCRLLRPECFDFGNNKTCSGKNTPLNFCIRLTHEEPLHYVGFKCTFETHN